MPKKVFVKYVGTGPAVLAGEFIQPGETREVFPYQVREAERYHPDCFVGVGAQTVNGPEAPKAKEPPAAPAGKPKGEKAPKAAERKQPVEPPKAEEPPAGEAQE